ncbi:hypothetical protein [Moraxella catarrhalis]|nr:hypothetical protein [Moraxella catarrhalis]
MMICIAISVKIQEMTVFSHSMGGRFEFDAQPIPAVADTIQTVSSASIS